MQDIAFDVENVTASYETATERGAQGVKPPTVLEDEFGVYECASIKRLRRHDAQLHQSRPLSGRLRSRLSADRPGPLQPPHIQARGLAAIDHIVANVEEGKMDEWVHFYQHVLGFSQLVSFDDKDISTEYTALMSKVVQNGTGRIKFPINEPAQWQAALADRRVLAVLSAAPACST